MTDSVTLISCHDCGQLQKISHLPDDGTVRCCRCDAKLRKRQRIRPEKSVEHTLALVLTAIVLFILANTFPIIKLQVEGHEMSTTLLSSVTYLYQHEMKPLAGLVFLTSIGAPLIQLGGLLYILLPLNFNRISWQAPQVYRYVRLISSWSMLEVLMLGILVSVVKLSAMAAVIPGIALWSFGLLIFVMAAILSDLDKDFLWERIGKSPRTQDMKPPDQGFLLVNCHNCNVLCAYPPGIEQCAVSCRRCGSSLHFRKPNSITRTSALLIAAFVMYIPANLLPVMEVSSFGSSESDTIMSGVIYLANSGDWPLALIVFIASILVPSIKLIILSLLVITVRFKATWRPKERTRLYRLTEGIGRWSMVDIFVDTLMAALVQIQGLMVIEVGIGAVAFGAVVVLTMLAAMSFDPRLIWDNLENVNE